MLLSAAGIQNLDKDHEPSRIAARGGLGAVMGSKRLKAIIIDAHDGEKPFIAHPEDYKRARKSFTDALMAHPQTAIYRDYGTAAIARMSNSFGGLPTRNFSSGQFEGVEKISGEYQKVILNDVVKGPAMHVCLMYDCSSNVYADINGK
jgi:aldehyde:ferredoxin oxidoreductase